MSEENRLGAAWSWYQESLKRLEAIGAWIKKSRPPFYETAGRSAPAEMVSTEAAGEGDERTGDPAELNRLLRPLLEPYANLSKKEALKRLKSDHDDLRQTALVRMFSGFEADFQRAFAGWLKATFDKVDPKLAARRDEKQILQGLPNSIELCLLLFQQLQPRFEGSAKGWLDGLRRWRNDVIHDGFAKAVEHDVDEAHQRLSRILELFAPPRDEAVGI